MKCIGFVKLIGLQVLIVILFVVIYAVTGMSTSTLWKYSQASLNIWFLISAFSYYILNYNCEYI